MDDTQRAGPLVHDPVGMRPPSWPDELTRAPFTLTEASSYGVSRRRADAASVHRPAKGVRSLGPVDAPVPLFLAVRRTLPEDVAFSHLTAVRLHDLPWSHGWTTDEVVHVTTGPGVGRIRRTGLAVHTGLQRRRAVTRHGLPVTGLGDTWIDLAALPDATVRDLVVVGDAIASRGGDQDLSGLHDVVARRPRDRGIVAARRALALVRPGSGSPMESLARVGFVADGLPEPELNATVTDRFGQWLARVDFLWREARVVVEFDGAHHADPAQFRRDARRRRAIEEAGCTYLQITATTVFRADEWAEFIARLGALLR